MNLMAALNLLNLAEDGHFCLELRTKGSMTLWLADHHTSTAAGGKDLVFTPAEAAPNTAVLVDNQLQVYALSDMRWYHARLFSVAINIDRFLLNTSRPNRAGIARVLPFQLCLANGSMTWSPQRCPSAIPPLAPTRHIGTAALQKYLDSAMVMRNMYDRTEWQMLARPSSLGRSLMVKAA